MCWRFPDSHCGRKHRPPAFQTGSALANLRYHVESGLNTDPRVVYYSASGCLADRAVLYVRSDLGILL